jgi:hypothetical protein
MVFYRLSYSFDHTRFPGDIGKTYFWPHFRLMMKIYSLAVVCLLTLQVSAQSTSNLKEEKLSDTLQQTAKPNLHDRARITEITAGRFRGGGRAPFSSSIGFNFAFAIPNVKRHRVTELTLGYDVLLDPSGVWYRRLVSTPYSNLLNPKNGRSLTAGVAVSRILLNRPGAALTLGPELMFRYFALPTAVNNLISSDGFQTYIVEPAPGLKARLFVGGHFTAKAEYIFGLKRKMKAGDELFPGSQSSVPINLSMIKVAIGFRL